jgi:hypothetical protein
METKISILFPFGRGGRFAKNLDLSPERKSMPI